MGLMGSLRAVIKSLLNRYGFDIVDSRILYDWQKQIKVESSFIKSQLPNEATNYLVKDNPRLKELHNRYSIFNNEVTACSVWTDSYVSQDDILYFRGDNAYVWQLRGSNMNELGYALATYYIKTIDKFDLLNKLEEDDLFGNYSFLIGNKVVSRDLLDSINEIYFLERHLNISSSENINILDIGSGYGRLAHRMLHALSNVSQYLCTDAYAISSFICEYYIRYRKLERRAKVVALDKIEDALKNVNIDIALNIHSFSECKKSAINWWINILAKYKVKYLMIVPNHPELKTNDGVDFSSIVEMHGYRMIAKEPKYNDPVVHKYAIIPSTYFLYELK
jgi:hypothetical protein